MTITIDPVDHGTSPGDKTGENAFLSFQKVNSNEQNIKVGIEELQGRFWAIQNSTLDPLVLGRRYMANAHAGIIFTCPTTFVASTTVESDIWVTNNDDANNITLTPGTGDSFFVKGVTLGVDATQALAPGEVAILSIRANNVSWDLTLIKATVGKQTLDIPRAAMISAATNGATPGQVETTALRPDIYTLDFIAASRQYAQFSWAFPKQYNGGTITFKVFWTSTAVDTDGVSWALQAVHVADNETIDVAYGTAVVVDDANQSAAEEQYVTVESAVVTIAGGTWAFGDRTYFQLYRDTDDANDTAVEAAKIIGAHVYWTNNTTVDD